MHLLDPGQISVDEHGDLIYQMYDQRGKGRIEDEGQILSSSFILPVILHQHQQVERVATSLNLGLLQTSRYPTQNGNPGFSDPADY